MGRSARRSAPVGRVRRGQTRSGGPCGSYRYTMSPPVGAVRGAGPVRGARFRFFVLPDVVGGAYAIERGLLAGVGRRDDGWRFRGERLRSPVVARARPGARCPPGAGRPGARVSGSVARARSLLERARGLTETIGIGRSPRGPGRTRRHRTVPRRTTARPDVRPGAPTYDRAGPGRTEPLAPARRRPLTAAAHPDRTLEHEEPRFRTALSGRPGLARSSQAHRGPTGEGPSGAGAGAGRRS